MSINSVCVCVVCGSISMCVGCVVYSNSRVQSWVQGSIINVHIPVCVCTMGSGVKVRIVPSKL